VEFNFFVFVLQSETPEAGFYYFSLLDFNLFVIIILKAEIVNITIT